MEENRDSRGPSEAGLPASYSTIRPESNRQPRPGIAALDLNNPSEHHSPSVRPSTTAKAYPSASSSAIKTSPIPGFSQRSLLPQSVIDVYPLLAKKTRMQVWRDEVNERNMWLESVRTWIQKTQKTMKENVRSFTNMEVIFMVTEISERMDEFMTELPRFQDQLNVAEACIEHDLQKHREEFQEYRRNLNSKLPSFRRPKLPASVALSGTQSHAASDITGVGTAAERQPSVVTNRDTELLKPDAIRIPKERPTPKASELLTMANLE
ncbi:hypothetical protein V8F06_010939 [Rhypophila decipiens]